ncbi:hypothetical protein EV424DRAFT_259818 [Suillus variegatus]|nr:hypothetical protein EV424DRAFT_259818 [Suillus variegatus]
MVKYSMQYSPVDGVDNDNEEESFGYTEGLRAESHPKLQILRVWPMLSHDTLIFTSILFFALWMGTPSPHLHDDIPVYSPASGAVESTIVRFNGTLDFPSIYRGPPSPEIDAAWARIAHGVLPTRMSLEEILKAGEVDSPSKVKYPPEFGGGFMVSMEAPHQLHYLTSQSLVARVLRPQGYFIPGYARSSSLAPWQNLMCNADVTTITWDWVKGHNIPYPNFNTRHQCRNYEKILDWAVEHAVHIPRSAVTRFEDTVDIPPN